MSSRILKHLPLCYNTLMVRHGHGHWHLHRKPRKDWFDYLLYAFMVATPLFELPQA